ncbi:hypothetical protein HOLleu_27023 [Holothuria leucospilota]|uniref:Ig-like domain-containing protein n=1 Tax=Holothuria leucospilota TaxID=206669 RepID=A0A9Q1H203_HOLLE|nr:hypothetical protein HOLleu_27023 [Holothuria leucospilota]
MFGCVKEARMCSALFCAIFAVTRSHLHRVAVSDPVTFECKGALEVDSYWKYGNEVLYFNRLKMSNQVGDNFRLLENYSLFISSALLSHQGTYECIRNSVGIATHILEVQVPPEVFITVGGHNAADVLQIDENEELNATCHALHSSPAVNLTWKLNDDYVESSLILHVSITNDGNNLTWDTFAFLKTFLQGERGNITCISSPQDMFTSKEVYLEYFQYGKFVSKVKPYRALLAIFSF